MKFDLISSAGVAIIGVIIGFMVTTLVAQQPQNYTVQTLDKTANGAAADQGYDYADFKEPNNEIFNYDALNPTVEVFIGECEEYDASGACVQVTTTEDENGDQKDKNSDQDTNSDDNPDGQETD